MIEGLVARTESGDESVIDELVDHTAAEPAAVAPYLLRLLDAGVFWRLYVLYRGADEDFQREVVAQIESGTDEGAAVPAHVLAQTRGPVVEEAFRRWAESSPPGPHFDPYRRGVAALTRDGGWELAPNGIRELCGTGAYRFVPGPDGERAEEVCPWCASPLWAALALDTADPKVADALAHTGWRGRLRVLTCHLSCFGTVCTEVAADGKASWSAHTVRPSILPVDGPEEPPLAAFVPGARWPTPFMASARDRGGSTLGGCPDWIDDPSYPDCPGCGRAMDYLALVGGADLDDAEGAYDVFLHAPCGLAAVEYQQS